MAATAVQYQYVTLSHGKTRYIEAGTGHPLILIHGFPFHHSADSWWPNIDGLASEFRVLAPDCVGWSPSDYFDQAYSFAYVTDFIREFQDALSISSSHIVGTSMGGWIAGLLSYESPDRVDRAVQTGHTASELAPTLG
jgi:pimeloyl-ACP methyl ester carboxylesterase